MQGNGAWTSAQSMPKGRSTTVRTRYSTADYAALLWRDRLLVVVVFALVLAAGTAFALTLPKTYTATSSLLVTLGQEYVYIPRAGDAGRGAVPKVDEVVQSEVQILSSDELKRRVIRSVGLKTIDPKLAAAWATADPLGRKEIEGKALKIVQKGLSIGTAPETGVVRLGFKHKDPDAAALILNRLVEGYLEYRKEVFVDVISPQIGQQRAGFERRLVDADNAYQNFLKRNGVSDFATEKASLGVLYQTVLDEQFKTNAALREAQGRLGSVRARIGEAPSEIMLQRDLDLSVPTKLLQLRADRQDLLSRYLPDAEPVKELDAKIAELDAMITSGRGVGEKDRRLGANPVWQDVEKQRIQLEAEAAALADRRDELGRQLAQVGQRQLRLAALDSEYQNLTVERDVLQTNVRAFAARQEENRAAEEIAKTGDDSIRVVERAAPPSEGKSLKRPVFGLVFLFALFTGLCAALVRVFSRRGIATAESASRTLDLPVLATARMKAA
jgi:uncharacterized protein involved in exopolysaccharide biosynthesis